MWLSQSSDSVMYFGREFEALAGRGPWGSKEGFEQTARLVARSLIIFARGVQTRSCLPPELHLVATCSLPGGRRDGQRENCGGRRVKWLLSHSREARSSRMTQRWKVAGTVWRSDFDRKVKEKEKPSLNYMVKHTV